MINGLVSAKPVHEKVWVGMSISSLNSLALGPSINSQKSKSIITSFGISKMDLPSIKKYFPLMSKVWRGMQVTLQNNEVNGYILQSKSKINESNLQNIFSGLLKLHGVKLNLTHYQSFSKKGYSVIWHHQNQMVSLNIIIEQSNQYNISLKKTYTTEKVSERYLNKNAIVALAPIFGKDLFNLTANQVADGRTNEDLESFLSNEEKF